MENICIYYIYIYILTTKYRNASLFFLSILLLLLIYIRASRFTQRHNFDFIEDITYHESQKESFPFVISHFLPFFPTFYLSWHTHSYTYILNSSAKAIWITFNCSSWKLKLKERKIRKNNNFGILLFKFFVESGVLFSILQILECKWSHFPGVLAFK